MSLLVLVGPPGALVAETAGEISRRHGVPFADTDAAIEQLAGEHRTYCRPTLRGGVASLREGRGALAFLSGDHGTGRTCSRAQFRESR